METRDEKGVKDLNSISCEGKSTLVTSYLLTHN